MPGTQNPTPVGLGGLCPWVRLQAELYPRARGRQEDSFSALSCAGLALRQDLPWDDNALPAGPGPWPTSI